MVVKRPSCMGGTFCIGVLLVFMGCASGRIGPGGNRVQTDSEVRDGSVTPSIPPVAPGCHADACEAFCARMGKGSSRCEDATCYCATGLACSRGSNAVCAISAGPSTGLGQCTAGAAECIGEGEFGTWGPCVGTGAPSAEICDGEDNDCDGTVDPPGCQCSDGERRRCGTDEGECVAGEQECIDGQWTTCTDVKPTQEQCDGLNNDCDAETDEGCQCTDGQEKACGRNAGVCTAGVQSCVDGRWTECSGTEPDPRGEVCYDNLDNDCNGAIDETCPQAELACGTPHLWMATHNGPNALGHSDYPAKQCTTSCGVTRVSSSRYELTCEDTNLWTLAAAVEAAAVDLIPANPRGFSRCLVAWGLHALRRIDKREVTLSFPTRTVRYLDATAFLDTPANATPLQAGGFQTTLPAFAFKGSYVGPAPERDSGTPIFMYGLEPSAPLTLRDRPLSRTTYQPARGDLSATSVTTWGALLDYVYHTEFAESRFVIPIDPTFYIGQIGHSNLLFVTETVCRRVDGAEVRQVSALGGTEEPVSTRQSTFPILLP